MLLPPKLAVPSVKRTRCSTLTGRCYGCAGRSKSRRGTQIVPTFPGSCTPASTTSSGEQAPSGVCTRSSNVVTRGVYQRRHTLRISVSASPSNNLSVVRNTGKRHFRVALSAAPASLDNARRFR